MKRLYAIGVLAQRKHEAKYLVESSIVATVALVHSEAEAVGIGHKIADERFPRADGWEAPNVQTYPISDDLVLAAAAEIGRGKAP